jgi:PAS domain S-box-containing protein
MKQDTKAQEKFKKLREQAEELMNSADFVKMPVYSEDPLKLIHELQTFQIELEMKIEELHRSQQELITARASYAELYDLAPVGYITIDQKGTIRMANKTLAGMLSIEREALINKPLYNHIVFEDQDIFYLYLQNLSESPENKVCELRMHKKNGSLFYVQLESTLAQEDSESQATYRTVVIDITDRKRSETLLQNSEKRLKALSEASFEAIFIYSKGICVDQNQTAEKLFGYSHSDAFGKRATDWIAPEDR